jgi:hypothetical protein
VTGLETGTLLRDPLTWVAATLSGGVAAWMILHFPLDPVLGAAIAALGLALFAGWLALGTATGRFRERTARREAGESRAWSERQTLRVHALRHHFDRLDAPEAATVLTELAAGHAAVSRALGTRPPDEAAAVREIASAARAVHDSGLSDLEDLAATLETLAAAQRDRTDHTSADAMAGRARRRAEALMQAALALTETGAERGAAARLRAMAAADVPARLAPPPPPHGPPPNRAGSAGTGQNG